VGAGDQGVGFHRQRRGHHLHHGPKLSRLPGKYGPLVPTLRALILRTDTPLENDVKDMIAAQLDVTRDRLAAIGHGHGGDSAVSPSSGAEPGSA
jgi:hypothetical protein